MLRYGLILAAAVVLVDQGVKWLVLDFFSRRAEPVEITDFFNLVLAWNRGISFSLFHSEEPYAPFALAALALGISVGLAFWLKRMASSSGEPSAMSSTGCASGRWSISWTSTGWTITGRPSTSPTRRSRSGWSSSSPTGCSAAPKGLKRRRHAEGGLAGWHA
jgi:hypothetical protein